MGRTFARLGTVSVMLCLFISGCISAPGCCGDLQRLPTTARGPYELDTGDTIRILVYNQQSLSTDYIVSDNGTVSVPTLGEIPARGLTVRDVQKEITDGLNKGILVDPGVSVQLVQARPIYIVGEVAKPGQYPYVAGLNILGAVATAGGFTVRADVHQMSVARTRQGGSKEWRAEPLDDVQPGDVVVIHEQFF